MRLSDFEQRVIIESFTTLFEPEDHLWLFGSRVDDTRKGGDIDLFIETSISKSELSNKIVAFLRAVMDKIGEQRIDVVTYHFGLKLRPIDEEARQTGIRLK